ncbi:uncharacterized protein C16orf86 homolog isoform X2 [Perognathus longimembris pacificus]|uniref:uncharacterized protein C16orf86 homolog isoform X2 n=1 Tax=Perognathus longimembris pacificus TaxID=214514 RepID=UPI002018FD44|nr:uncharacterized protein C16orf86 homolog isoform X2 [Perognathus longimembris pacificus]
MISTGAKREPGSQEGATVGSAQVAENPECPVMGDQCLAPAPDACKTLGEIKCSPEHSYESELQEEGLKPEEEGLGPKAEPGEERSPRPLASVPRPSHGPKRKPIKVEAELSPGLPLQREEQESSQSEPSPSAKPHKKAKKRKSLGTPVLPVAANTAPAPPETLGLERKAQRLRPLYQYINYCNPELNQAGEGDGETEVEPKSESALVPEETGVAQLQALRPMAGELGLGLALPSCPNVLVPPTHALVPPLEPSLGEETGEDLGGLSNLRVSGSLKAEMDKLTQVDIDKMLSVCAAPLVPPLSPQYK